MKRIFLSILILLVFAIPANARVLVNDDVEGAEIITFEVATTGDWQPITVPATMRDTRHVFIQVHDGVETVGHSDVEFFVSSSSDGTSGFIWTYGIQISIGVPSAGVVCYIKADAQQLVTVMVLR